MELHDTQDIPVDRDRLVALARHVLTVEGYPRAEVSLLLVDEGEIAIHHRDALGIEGPTDVLSFPLEDLRPGTAPSRAPEEPPLGLGDVMIAPGYVRRQAADHGVSFESEMALMVVHGLLHLMGYDHVEDDEAELMEAKETAYLASMGVKRR